MKTKLILLLAILFFQKNTAQDITGSWYGELSIQGISLPLAIHLEKNDNSYTGTMDSPNQKVYGVPISKITHTHPKVLLEINDFGFTFSGDQTNASTLKGNISQNGMSIPMILTRKKTEIKPLAVPTDNKQITQALDNYITHLENNQLEAGAISVFKNGKEIYNRTFGQKSLPNYTPKNAFFQIGSISKMYTAVMIHQLIEEKKLSYTTPLSQFFPTIPSADKITIQQLLNHKSGLGDYVENTQKPQWLKAPVTDKEILDFITNDKLRFTPGSSTSYSNSGYYLLSKIIEMTTKSTYETQLQSRILKPLALNETHSAAGNPKHVYKPFEFTNQWKEISDFSFKNVIGVGDIAATPRDLNAFNIALQDNKILPKNVVSKILPEPESKFGMGILAVPFYDKVFWGHSGGTYGTNSLTIYNPEEQIAISYSLNVNRIGINDFSIAVLNCVYQKEFEFPKAHTAQLASSKLNIYTGSYLCKDYPIEMEVFIKDEVLFAQIKGQPNFPLTYVAKDEFVYDPVKVKLVFEPENKILKLLQNGQTIVFVKK